MRLRTVQQLLNMVIDGGYYNPYCMEDEHSNWMCVAVHYATKKGTLLEEEAQKLYRAIDQYLLHLYGSTGTLGAALHRNNLPWEFHDRLAIYRDWKNRPRKVK